ncbi:hypothetical protein CGLO_11341 [Colletotrichum gloeosporioides Cg-14]|uniref:Uncharacterized protein n=1 Tax=Colletotrichum gloeosporioides (strain Cg-14) TaxID=1237896 RepID=T0KBB5_COLGC|nr:hypothetical protein CGLO_11341 [Colletotrichum gloeosporioides Cg-14]
MNYIGINA